MLRASRKDREIRIASVKWHNAAGFQEIIKTNKYYLSNNNMDLLLVLSHFFAHNL